MKAEAIALWGLLWFITFLDIPQVQIFGDSKCLIDHVNGNNNIQQVSLQGSLKRIKSIWNTFQNPSIQHINRTHKKIADDLSTKGLLATEEDIYIMMKMGADETEVESLKLSG